MASHATTTGNISVSTTSCSVLTLPFFATEGAVFCVTLLFFVPRELQRCVRVVVDVFTGFLVLVLVVVKVVSGSAISGFTYSFSSFFLLLPTTVIHGFSSTCCSICIGIGVVVLKVDDSGDNVSIPGTTGKKGTEGIKGRKGAEEFSETEWCN